jgi:hypothetical protein
MKSTKYVAAILSIVASKDFEMKEFWSLRAAKEWVHSTTDKTPFTSYGKVWRWGSRTDLAYSNYHGQVRRSKIFAKKEVRGSGKVACIAYFFRDPNAKERPRNWSLGVPGGILVVKDHPVDLKKWTHFIFNWWGNPEHPDQKLWINGKEAKTLWGLPPTGSVTQEQILEDITRSGLGGKLFSGVYYNEDGPDCTKVGVSNFMTRKDMPMYLGDYGEKVTGKRPNFYLEEV